MLHFELLLSKCEGKRVCSHTTCVKFKLSCITCCILLLLSLYFFMCYYLQIFRYYARYSLNLLMSHPDFDKTVSRVFTTQHSLSKCKEVVENLKNKVSVLRPTCV